MLQLLLSTGKQTTAKPQARVSKKYTFVVCRLMAPGNKGTISCLFFL